MRQVTPVMFAIVAALAVVPADASGQKKQRDLITREEIQQSSQKDQDLLAVIRAVRPHFLAGPRGVRTIGGGMQNPLMVVVDGRRESGPDVLVQIMAAQVEEVRYLEPARAQNQYGVNANGGAIVVRMIDAKSVEQSSRPPSGARD